MVGFLEFTLPLTVIASNVVVYLVYRRSYSDEKTETRNSRIDSTFETPTESTRTQGGPDPLDECWRCRDEIGSTEDCKSCERHRYREERGL